MAGNPLPFPAGWAIGAAASADALHAFGRGFESLIAHHLSSPAFVSPTCSFLQKLGQLLTEFRDRFGFVCRGMKSEAAREVYRKLAAERRMVVNLDSKQLDLF